jgi:hypothetical protein
MFEFGPLVFQFSRQEWLEKESCDSYAITIAAPLVSVPDWLRMATRVNGAALLRMAANTGIGWNGSVSLACIAP